jgi:hypothetical protein
MSFLKNDICEIEILTRRHLLFNDDDTVKHMNLVSSTFFKRESYYKNFGIYMRGLKKTVDMIDNHNRKAKSNADMEEFYFLLFIDANARDDSQIMNIIESSEYVIPALFTCSRYMQQDGKYHLDLFGTLLRFFPMFNFDFNPAKNIVCIDIDLNKDDLRKIEFLMKNQPKGVTGSGTIDRLIYLGELPYMYSGTLMFNRKKLDKDIITKFIASAHTIAGTGHYGKRTTTFGYGIDEMFLNSHLLPIVGEFSNIIEYQISYFLYHSAPYIKAQKRETTTKEVLKLILHDLYNPNMSVDNMLNLIQKSQLIPDLTREIRRQSRTTKDSSTDELEDTDNTNESESEDINILDQKYVEISDTDNDQIVNAAVEQTDSNVHKILHKLLGDKYNPTMSIDKMLNLVDKKTYNVREKNEVNNGLAERFYYILHDLVKHNKTWLESDVMKLIDNNLRNVISAIVLFTVDPADKKITKVTTYDTVYTDNIL